MSAASREGSWRGCARRSGAGTQRLRYANDSEVHSGHVCWSWISSQSRQRRATWSCMLFSVARGDSLQRGNVDHEAILHVPLEEALVGLVDLLDRDQLDIP